MNKSCRSIVLLLLIIHGINGCSTPPTTYGREQPLWLPGSKPQVWAVAPVLNLSGQDGIDPFLQADLLYQQLQQVRGLTVIPVNRVADVYASLGITKVESSQQASVVCDLLGCDGLVVATVTAFDPYNPPKFGGSLQLFGSAGTAVPARVDPRELMRQAAPPADQPLPRQPDFRQAVGMFDASNGSVRDALFAYAAGRNDPLGPLGPKEYLMNMDRYCGFAYHALIEQLVNKVNGP